MHLPLLSFLSMIKVPVAIKSGTHDLQVIHNVQWVRRRLRLTRLLILVFVWFLEQETIESAVTSWDHIADLHFFAEGP